MTRADRVLSTPHTNTSALPVDQARRRLLTIATGGAIAAALPVAALANGPDAIFAAIERHRELSADYTAAVDISSKLEDGPEFEAADAITGDRCGDLLDHADALILLEPTTIAGIIALMRYVASLEEWQTPQDSVEFDGQPPDWHKAFCTTVANALDRIGGEIA
jgi:hypothetical protein